MEFLRWKAKCSDSQIIAIMKQNEQGVSVPDFFWEHGMGSAQFYKWAAKFGGVDLSMMKRFKELEEENRRSRDSYKAISAKRDDHECGRTTQY